MRKIIIFLKTPFFHLPLSNTIIWETQILIELSKVLKFIRPSPNSVFECHNPKGIKFLTRLRLGLSHLREHKFKHNFQDSLNPLWKCGAEVESTSHSTLHCPIYNNDQSFPLSTIRNIDYKLLEIPDSFFTQTLLYGNPSFDVISNSLMLNATINFIKSFF